jgi:hypothetical protein
MFCNHLPDAGGLGGREQLLLWHVVLEVGVGKVDLLPVVQVGCFGMLVLNVL